MASTNINFVTFLLLITSVMAQRSPYAGRRPANGYKDKLRPETNSSESVDINTRVGEEVPITGPQRPPGASVPVVVAENVFIPLPTLSQSDFGIANRAGQPDRNIQTPSTRLPYDAYGDKQLVDHLNSLPIENRPFWLINYQAIEAQRNNTASNFGSPGNVRGSFLG